MDNQPANPGTPAAHTGDPINQTKRFADGRGISDMAKNKGKHNDDAAYADDKTRKGNNDEATEEDFKPFDLDKISDKQKDD